MESALTVYWKGIRCVENCAKTLGMNVKTLLLTWMNVILSSQELTQPVIDVTESTKLMSPTTQTLP